ncbi:MAG: translation initiation factor IF-2 [Geminicoccaceae bacterium]
MTDPKGQDRTARIGLTGRPAGGRIELKKTVETGMVRQSFSHGRSKSVAVEVKKTRTPVPAPRPTAAGAAPAPAATPATGTPPPAPATGAPPAREARPLEPRPGDTARPAQRRMVLKPLTDEEKASRLKALSEARRGEEEARQRAEENSRRAQAEAARRAAEEAAAAKRKADEDARRKVEEEARRKAEEQAAKLLADEERRQRETETATPRRAESTPARPAEPTAEARPGSDVGAKRPPLKAKAEIESEADDSKRGKLRGGKPEKRPVLKRPPEKDGKRPLKVTLGDGEDDNVRMRSLAALRRQRERERRQMSGTPEAVVREVVLPETITVQDLAARMAVRGAEVVKVLMKNGIMATINQSLDPDTAELVVSEFGHKVKRVSEADVEIGLEGETDQETDLQARSPVVTVMGHVDHGKTSLLDALRRTDVVAHEAGGITQHIGAYRVDVGQGRPVTFIDTPGHAAFTQMRARGASVTDVVILVVAADDGVMPQTVEAISHAKAAGVPIIVAINKIDKPDANPDQVKQELLSHDVVLEDFGGDVLAVPVSATKKMGLDKLIEAVQLQAELLDLKANPDRDAQGTIIEARLDRGRGVVATVLVQKGTLKVGDIVVAGGQWGRARALVNDRGENVEEAGPSIPVEILGLDGVPDAGDTLVAVDSERRAREITDYRQRKKRDQAQVIATGVRGSLENMFTQLKAGTAGELPVVVKSDVHGSLEAISAGLEKLGTDEVKVRVLHGGVGAITESDVTLASASKALILGFNVRANAPARDMAKRDGVEIRYYSIIYELLDELKGMLSGMLAPEAKEVILGHAEIREIFNVPKVGKIAGCRVVDGLIKRQAKCRLLRDNVVIFQGELGSLKRFKDDVREVKEGFECGMSIENYNDIRQGDVIEAFEVEEVARTL